MPLSSSSSDASSSRATPLPLATRGPSPPLVAAARLPCILDASFSQKPAIRSEMSVPASNCRRFASFVRTSLARFTCLKMSSACSRSTSGSETQRSGCHLIASRRKARLISGRLASFLTPRTAYGSSPPTSSLSSSSRRRAIVCRSTSGTRDAPFAPAASALNVSSASKLYSPKMASSTGALSTHSATSALPPPSLRAPYRTSIRRCASLSAASLSASPLASRRRSRCLSRFM
mmetsp:Transcript_14402/g.24559  ORF Transcript_14402/g.24559 Transcript_14402/m.24559 type:complete len:233 (-) Transcript_14402:350-1048(-)